MISIFTNYLRVYIRLYDTFAIYTPLTYIVKNKLSLDMENLIIFNIKTILKKK